MSSSINKNKDSGYFVRKIVQSEIWLGNPSKQCREVLIEPARYEFRTKNNALSWWYISDTTTSTLNKVAASLISIYNQPEAMPLDLLLVPANLFWKDMDMVQSNADANTAVNSMKDSHFNMENINIKRMNHIYKILDKAIQTCEIKRVQFDDALQTLKAINLNPHEQMGKMGGWIKEQIKKS